MSEPIPQNEQDQALKDVTDFYNNPDPSVAELFAAVKGLCYLEARTIELLENLSVVINGLNAMICKAADQVENKAAAEAMAEILARHPGPIN